MSNLVRSIQQDKDEVKGKFYSVGNCLLSIVNDCNRLHSDKLVYLQGRVHDK
jgi:hypothetical protein